MSCCSLNNVEILIYALSLCYADNERRMEGSVWRACAQNIIWWAGGAWHVAVLMYVGLLVLLVLIAACAVLGLVYCYIYHTRINPTRTSRSHVTSGSGQASGGGDDGTVTTTSNVAVASTHLMLFRKSWRQLQDVGQSAVSWRRPTKTVGVCDWHLDLDLDLWPFSRNHIPHWALQHSCSK